MQSEIAQKNYLFIKGLNQTQKNKGFIAQK
jgi:hypothetical protein